MFAIWRVPAPWQPVTKKGQGQRMGGGKGAIDHYVTPIKAGRVIIEVGGTCEFEEVMFPRRTISLHCPIDNIFGISNLTMFFDSGERIPYANSQKVSVQGDCCVTGDDGANGC